MHIQIYINKKISFKELACAIVGIGKPRSAGQASRLELLGKELMLQSSGRISCFFGKPVFALQSVQAVQSLSHVQLFATLWIAAHQASLSITNSQSLPKFMSIGLVMPSNHLILCRPLLLLPSIFLSIRVFSKESALCIRWPKYWSFSFNISPSNEHPGLISFKMDWLISLQSKGLSRVFSNTTVQKHQFFGTQLSLWSNSHIHTWLLEKP